MNQPFDEFAGFDGLNFDKIDKKYLNLFIVKKIIDGKLTITEEQAKKLKSLVPNVPYTFWISMQQFHDELVKKN